MLYVKVFTYTLCLMSFDSLGACVPLANDTSNMTTSSSIAAALRQCFASTANRTSTTIIMSQNQGSTLCGDYHYNYYHYKQHQHHYHHRIHDHDVVALWAAAAACAALM